MKRGPIAALLIVLAAAGGGAWWWFTHRPPEGPLTLMGNVEVRQVNLGFKVAGRIQTLKVDEGDSIVAEQTLAQLEKVYFQDNINQLTAQRDQAKANLAKLVAGNRAEDIAQAEANVKEKEATLANAKIALDRADQLLKRAVGTQKAYDDALAAQREADARLNVAREALRLMKAGFRVEDIDAARAQLAGSEAALQVAQRQLADADLTAPSKGVVLSRVREVGAIVAAGETVFVVSLTDPVWVRSYVSAVDLGRIKPGMEVAVRIDTPGAPVLKGRIGFISTTAEFTPKTVETQELRTALVYRIRIVVSDTGDILRQGMPVTVSVLDAVPIGDGKQAGSEKTQPSP
ncbi:MAG TPA: efflux RND transporter periplasmic adaptor subunit [Hyphomicrobiaceae bacterium]|nr:efflux RND transporter periplasmic adaptor subunit [Hyphomicrobiaceae bacterium]